MADEKLVCECAPDYKAEYYRLINEVMRLKNENAELKGTLIGLCKSVFMKEGAVNAE